MINGEQYLLKLPRFSELGAEAMKPGLERIRELMDLAANPQQQYPIVHVGGTNGKGSTASMLSAILTAEGYRTGLFTSPHISSVRERFRIDGGPVSPDVLSETVESLIPAFDAHEPSFFEAVTAVAFSHFARSNVDVAVIEVGLGGRLDATNIVAPVLSVITSIGFDHTDLLGPRIEDIAREKSGIIKPGVPVVTSASAPALDVIRDTAGRLNSPLYTPAADVEVAIETLGPRGSIISMATARNSYRSLSLGTPGRHQITNATAAVLAAELLEGRFRISETGIRKGLEEVRALSGLSGRLQMVNEAPPVFLDAGHNADGIAASLGHLETCYPESAITVGIGLMKDKDLPAIAAVLAHPSVSVVPIELPQQRAASAEDIVVVAEESGVSVLPQEQVVDLIDRFVSSDRTTSDPLLLTGSHMLIELAAEALRAHSE